MSVTCPLLQDTQGQENGIINLYPQRLYQKIYGFGGAFTDSAGYVFSLMPEELRRQFLCDCFSEKGLCYTWGRCPVDSCDFSLECYAADDDPTDETLAHFSLDRPLRYSLPLIREAGQVAGRSIQLMLTPWSPPAYMKTNGSRIGGGRLRPEYAERWARYLCRYILALRELGLDVRLLSVQNEAKAAQTWDSCLYTAREEREFIEHYLAPQLSRAHLDDICLLIWDHNKERAYERMSETLQSDAVREPGRRYCRALVQRRSLRGATDDSGGISRQAHGIFRGLHRIPSCKRPGAAAQRTHVCA